MCVCVCRVPLLMAFTVTESEKITRRKKATTPCGTKRNEMAAKAENSVAVATSALLLLPAASFGAFFTLLFLLFGLFLLDEFLLFVTLACGNSGLTPHPLPHKKTCLKRRGERKKMKEKTVLSSITPRALSRLTLLLWAFNLFHQPFLFRPLSQSLFPLSVHEKTICA